MKISFKVGIFPFIILLMLGCKPAASDLINKKASLNGITELPENPLEMTPLTVSLQSDGKAMSTLYGNSIAAKRLKDGTDYAVGSTLYFVTWKGKADPDWFGARIPDTILAIERVSIGGDGKKTYTFFKGHERFDNLNVNKGQRLAMILSIPIATSP